MRLFALALALALGLAVITLAAQRSNILTNGRNLQIPINHGLPDTTASEQSARVGVFARGPNTLA